MRNFTKHPSARLDERTRGTYAGVAAMVPYLKDLGVTAVELMPVHQYDPQEGSHWGYMTLGFFAPHHVYARDSDAEAAAAEFRAMVKALHAADIEVILDVVYNHTTEGDQNGPTYSFRGIDNSTYYALDPNDLSRYFNFSACGNDLRTSHPAVRRLVVDSLRYWAVRNGRRRVPLRPRLGLHARRCRESELPGPGDHFRDQRRRDTGRSAAYRGALAGRVGRRICPGQGLSRFDLAAMERKIPR